MKTLQGIAALLATLKTDDCRIGVEVDFYNDARICYTVNVSYTYEGIRHDISPFSGEYEELLARTFSYLERTIKSTQPDAT